jgi:hypothetical protein
LTAQPIVQLVAQMRLEALFTMGIGCSNGFPVELATMS